MNEARDLLGLPSKVGATALVSTNEVQSVPVADTPKRGANTGLVTRTITKLARSPYNPFGKKNSKEVGVEMKSWKGHRETGKEGANRSMCRKHWKQGGSRGSQGNKSYKA